MRLSTRLLLPLAALLLPSTVQAWDFSLLNRDFTLDVTDTFQYSFRAVDRDPSSTRYRPWEPDDKYHHVLNTLDVSLSHADFRLGGRFDLNLFADSPADDPNNCPGQFWCGKRYENDFAPERLYLLVARPEFDATMGDFYASLGKGLALNVVKLDELGQDTTIRGGKFVYHDHDLGVTFLAGQLNPLDLDVATGYMAPWSAEPLLAGRTEYNFFETVIAGTHAVYIIHDDPEKKGVDVSRTDHDLVWGAGLEAPGLLDGDLSLAGEFDIQRTVDNGAVIRGPGAEGEGIDGIAAYASATYQLGELTLLGEYKYYDNFDLKAPTRVGEPYALLYHHPPTLERITADVKDNTSISGARLRADYNLGELGPLELLVFLNYGYFQDWHTGDMRIHNPFGGFELLWSGGEGKLQAEGGLRRTYDANNDQLAYRDIHFELDVEQPLMPRHSLKLSYQMLKRFEADPLGDRDWLEMDLALSYKWSPYLSVAFTFERQGDPRVVRETENYIGGFVRYYVTPSTYVNLRVGENRGGIKCYLGTCRYVPPFSGMELQGVVRF